MGDVLQLDCYTSLRGMCKEYSLPYSSAVRGKVKWNINGITYEIQVLVLNKIKGRYKGTSVFGKSNKNLLVGKHYEPF